MPAPATRHHIEFGLPEDQGPLLLRVRLDGEWAGDLLFASVGARSTFVDALTTGEISVVRCPIRLTDVREALEVAPAAGATEARNS
jgi:hypothetical protein